MPAGDLATPSYCGPRIGRHVSEHAHRSIRESDHSKGDDDKEDSGCLHSAGPGPPSVCATVSSIIA